MDKPRKPLTAGGFETMTSTYNDDGVMMRDQFALSSAIDYCRDAWQRSVLTLEALNERGNIHLAQAAKEVPNVLNFANELVLDGRKLPRPVNYGLVRILPPDRAAVDPLKPPIVVVDPRAGHGPGIGGMKPESEIGVAIRAGHPCYFVGFSPDPMPGQTIEDVCRAEAAFVDEVARRHPEAESKPIVIANCQAGWQTMMTAAIRPDLVGAIVVAGSPLSYWAGVHGKNPMRYLGGLLGGTWLTALSSDLGAGKFDGASLIANFEQLNPANTYWTKEYDVYSKVDTETQRFLEFETYWGSPVLLNAGEMQWIVDNLFVGNKLSTGQIRTSDGVRSTSEISNRRSSSSAPGATISPRRSRRWIGFSTCTRTSTRSSPTVRPSSIRCITASDTWGFSFLARSPRKNIRSSCPAWT
jgi:pimeloyl-ACP methyl ester carboxylesterase